MQPQQQPAPPAPKVTDTSLARMWAPREDVLNDARVSAQHAEGFEQAARDKWAVAQAARGRVAQLLAEAAEAEAKAAEAEAEAKANDHQASLHRQDETHHLGTASEIAAAVEHLRLSNKPPLMHPEERRQRAEQAAAANGLRQPSDTPIGDLLSASADPSQTAPFTPAPSEVAS